MDQTSSPPPSPKYLKDYRPPAWLVPSIELEVDLEPDGTVVSATLDLRRNSDPDAPREPLTLDGEDLELLGLTLDGEPLSGDRYELAGERLVIDGVEERASLGTRVRINPKANTRLEGLYVSNGVFCTQCEPEGFRRITFFPDRPDVMSRYRVRISSPKDDLPVILSNGNLVAREELADGRHAVVWEDPFAKPSYLFALVAGDLASVEDRFTTRSGRDVRLEIYTEHRHIEKCGHAMASLKKAMKWDEDRFGFEYDLDRFMIVAISDFNMGAMENKGLNVFNTKYVLAKPATATDADYRGIESVVAHEYFHNWTGNRITCRDWFQLSLKEGLTVFRDEEFTSDLHSRPVKRIGDVRRLRAAQFPEDAGPLAHPVRPESYVEINNFYTATVYNKGAEVIRMLHTLIGEDAFQAGMRLYVLRHDGQAVTCEDFVAAMEAASGRDLSRFRLWYSQAGTPRLKVERRHDPERATLTLTVRQAVPSTPGQPVKRPMPIPLAVGLLDPDGRPLALRLEGENAAQGSARVLEVNEAEQSFVFADVPALPVPSLLRGFSAPVILEADLDPGELAHLARHDPDAVARWEAMQRLATDLLLDTVAGEVQPEARVERFVETIEVLLEDPDLDPAFRAEILALPSEAWLGEQMETIDVDGIHAARKGLQVLLGQRLRDGWLECFERHRQRGPYTTDAPAMGRRALKNLALAYLMRADDAQGRQVGIGQFEDADNMTDRLAALALLIENDGEVRTAALCRFFEDWQDEPLVVDKWFSLQAMAPRPDSPETVMGLAGHPAFSLANPNRVRSLVGAFASGNPTGFHRQDGAGYRFVADRIVEIGKKNPQLAARLTSSFSRWRRYDGCRQTLMKGELEKILGEPGTSRDVFEIATKSLGG